jgi:DNA-binding response OmpR family regulator
MKKINNIAVFDNDKCFIAMMKGYCYANNIAITEIYFNTESINEVEKLQPILIMVPLEWLCNPKMSHETSLIKNAVARGHMQICALNKNSTDIVSSRLLEWINVIINNPFDITEIDEYINRAIFLKSCLTEKRSNRERRSVKNRRNFKFNNGEDKVTFNSIYHREIGNPGSKYFKLDRRSKCVFLKGDKVNLTPKEFELFELLLTDVDRVFMTDEIINHLWPESNRATKADLYQYMHLLRKKIENDPNNPQWLITVKGFGYKLNISNTEKHQDYSEFIKEFTLNDADFPISISTYW